VRASCSVAWENLMGARIQRQRVVPKYARCCMEEWQSWVGPLLGSIS
jgi:hypothetical protein